MDPICRRRALQLGGVGLASTVVGGLGLAQQVTSQFEPVGGAALVEPEVLRSTGGRLEVRLEAGEGRVTLAGREAYTLGYNGGVPGPTWHLQKLRMGASLITPYELPGPDDEVAPEQGHAGTLDCRRHDAARSTPPRHRTSAAVRSLRTAAGGSPVRWVPGGDADRVVGFAPHRRVTGRRC